MSLPAPLRFVPYEDLGTAPNVIVDGPPNRHSTLTLSHWPQSGTPRELKADTSAEIAFRYLERPAFHADVELVSNDHFDEDGLVGLYILTQPSDALRERELLIDVATAGDFATYRQRRAARVAFVVSAFADPELSPLPSALFEQEYPQMAASLYRELLPRLPEMTARIDDFREHWEEEDAWLDQSEAALASGQVQIEELPALDLAIVTLPDTTPARRVHRFTQPGAAPCHPMAIHNATGQFRVLLVQGRSYELQFRYESWVQYLTRKPLPRVDLAPLVERLSEREAAGAHWQFGGVEEIAPQLELVGTDESRISPESFRKLVLDFLEVAEPAWDPYDP